MIMFTSNTLQYRSDNSMRRGKSRDQLIIDHHMVIHMEGFIPTGMQPSRIDSYSIDINLPPDDHCSTPVENSSHELLLGDNLYLLELR